MPQDIGDNRIIDRDVARVDWAHVERLGRHKLLAGDIVYSRRGDVERRALVRKENEGWLCGTGCLRVTFGPDPVVDSRFVAYHLGTTWTRKWIVQHAVGATMLNLNTAILSSVPLRVPAIEEQRAIAEVLGALDDKIAANARLSTTARELAAARCRRALMSPAQDVTLGDILTLEYGKALPAAARREGNVPVYGSGGVVGHHDRALVDGPSIVVGRKGSAGSVHWSAVPCFPIDTTFFVSPRSEVPLVYCFFALKSLRLSEMNSDSAVPGLNRNEAYAARLRLPDATALQSLEETARPLFTLDTQLQTESAGLARVRDALLPGLMSGKIRVKNAESVVEEVV